MTIPIITHRVRPSARFRALGCRMLAAVVLFAPSAGTTAEMLPLPPGVRLVSDVPFLETGRDEKLDVYLPARDDGGLRPAIVYFHGGGWVRGDKATERERNIGGKLAASGFVFVSANYVLGPRAWPQNLRDCKNAIRFVRANAARYGVDPQRIAAMGTSAGGHLALMAAYTGQGSPAEFEPGAPYPGISSAVVAVVDFYGMTNLLTRQIAAPDGTPTGKPMDSHAPEVLGVTRTEDRGRWELASPITHVRADSPPTLIVHGLSDPTVDYVQAVELANALRARAVPHELLLLEGIGHMFFLDAWNGQPMPDLTPAVTRFLHRHMTRTPLAGARE